jgi:carbonic anhydrase
MSSSQSKRVLSVVLPQVFLGVCVLVLAGAIAFQGRGAATATADEGEASAHATAPAHGDSAEPSAQPEHGTESGRGATKPARAAEASHAAADAVAGEEERAAEDAHAPRTERAAKAAPAAKNEHAAKTERGAESSNDLVRRLLDGNRRFVESRVKHPNQEKDRRMAVSKKQEPFAVILCCSDSRVPPEVIFDQGIGDLFVVRVAGNSADPAVLGSIEYAVEHLKASLIVVLGHERCGAVKAATEGGEAPGHVKAILEPIAPAVKAARAVTKGEALPEQAMRIHAQNMVKQLKESTPVLAALVREGMLTVVGARYDLDTGVVELLK